MTQSRPRQSEELKLRYSRLIFREEGFEVLTLQYLFRQWQGRAQYLERNFRRWLLPPRPRTPLRRQPPLPFYRKRQVCFLFAEAFLKFGLIFLNYSKPPQVRVAPQDFFVLHVNYLRQREYPASFRVSRS